MLIEGAIRFAKQTHELCLQNKYDFALEPYQRCRTILLELNTSARRDVSDLTRRVASLYSFLYHRLAEAYFQRQMRGFDEVIRILDEERTTWQEVCQRMPEAPNPGLLPAGPADDISTAGMSAIAPPEFGHYGNGDGASLNPTSHRGFSLEV
jgi:flagellin-specific chaperone FliS